MDDIVLTDLVERSDSDGHFDTVLAVHVWGFSPHGAAGRYQHLSDPQAEWSAPSQGTTQDCVELRADMDTIRSGKTGGVHVSLWGNASWGLTENMMQRRLV